MIRPIGSRIMLVDIPAYIDYSLRTSTSVPAAVTADGPYSEIHTRQRPSSRVRASTRLVSQFDGLLDISIINGFRALVFETI